MPTLRNRKPWVPISSCLSSRLTCLLSFLLLIGMYSYAMADHDQPELKPLIISNFLSGNMDFDKVPFPYAVSATVKFNQNDDRNIRMFRLEFLIEADMEALRTAFPIAVQGRLPPETCTTRVTPHSPRVESQGDGTALATERVRYEKFDCGQKICGSLKRIKTCPVRTPGRFQKTVDLSVRLTPKITSNRDVIIDLSSSLDDNGGIPNFILNLVGAFTYNIGSKLLSDKYQSIISEINTKLPYGTRPIDILTENEELKELTIPRETKFVTKSGRLIFQVRYESDRTYRAAVMQRLRDGVKKQFEIQEEKTASEKAKDEIKELRVKTEAIVNQLKKSATELSALLVEKEPNPSMTCVRLLLKKPGLCYANFYFELAAGSAFRPPVREQDLKQATSAFRTYEFERGKFIDVISNQRRIVHLLSLTTQNDVLETIKSQESLVATFDSQIGLFESYMQARKEFETLAVSLGDPGSGDPIPFLDDDPRFNLYNQWINNEIIKFSDPTNPLIERRFNPGDFTTPNNLQILNDSRGTETTR